MKDRIILLIKAKNLTAAQFADEIGVQKSSISHIISGRNNASLDLIQKVLLCYPEVSMDWLMFGKGPIFKGHETAVNAADDGNLNAFSPLISPPVDLFSEINPGKPIDFGKQNDLSYEPVMNENAVHDKVMEMGSFPGKENNVAVPDSTFSKPEKRMETIGHKNTSTKTLLKIVEFYTDNTYREYFPD